MFSIMNCVLICALQVIKKLGEGVDPQETGEMTE